MNNIYLGSRGEDFKNLIVELLSRGKLKAKYIENLINEEGMKEYGKAFTAASADSKNNYEQFEQLGDVSANKFIVWYVYKRFPQLDCPQGVKVAARLRINYGAKESFAPLAEKLGFWNFISAVEEDTTRGNIKCRSRNKKDLLEDTFEAFVGCTEYLLDKIYRPGVGYGIVYDILTNIFNDLPISLKFEDLFDPKTRLKETFDSFPELGTWKFIDSNEVIEKYSIAKSVLYIVPKNAQKMPIKIKGPDGKVVERPQIGWQPIGEGSSSRKGYAQQLAATQGLEKLKLRGYYREPPPEYKFFCQ